MSTITLRPTQVQAPVMATRTSPIGIPQRNISIAQYEFATDGGKDDTGELQIEISGQVYKLHVAWSDVYLAGVQGEWEGLQERFNVFFQQDGIWRYRFTSGTRIRAYVNAVIYH